MPPLCADISELQDPRFYSDRRNSYTCSPLSPRTESNICLFCTVMYFKELLYNGRSLGWKMLFIRIKELKISIVKRYLWMIYNCWTVAKICLNDIPVPVFQYF
jgi:hypothetical protein